MKTALILALALGALASAEDKDRTMPPPSQQDQQQGEAGSYAKRRIESVTWNLKTHKLVWVVQTGSDVDGKFVASKTDQYEISPDDAVMAVAQEKRGFTADEAKSLHNLLDVLSMYCAESVVWWDQGMGVPLDPGADPDRAPQQQKKQLEDGPAPRRVEQPLRRSLPRLPSVAELQMGR